VDNVPTGRLGLDGKILIPLDGAVMRARHRAAWSGAAVATLVLDKAGRLKADPQVTVQGLLDPELDADHLDDVAAAVRTAVTGLSGDDRGDDAAVKEAARLAVRRTLHASHGKKPVTDVHVVRV
jgi:ribonuclease J